jgi:hypothetical protein
MRRRDLLKSAGVSLAVLGFRWEREPEIPQPTGTTLKGLIGLADENKRQIVSFAPVPVEFVVESRDGGIVLHGPDVTWTAHETTRLHYYTITVALPEESGLPPIRKVHALDVVLTDGNDLTIQWDADGILWIRL